MESGFSPQPWFQELNSSSAGLENSPLDDLSLNLLTFRMTRRTAGFCVYACIHTCTHASPGAGCFATCLVGLGTIKGARDQTQGQLHANNIQPSSLENPGNCQMVSALDCKSTKFISLSSLGPSSSYTVTEGSQSSNNQE